MDSVRLIGAALGLLVLGSSCSAAVVLSQFPPNPQVLPGGGWRWTPGTTFADPPPPRAWVNGVYGGVPKIAAVEAVTIAGRAGPLAVTATRAVGIVDAAAAVARCLAMSTPICVATGVAAAAAVAYADYRIRAREHVPGSNSPAGSLDYDPGQDEVFAGQWCNDQYNVCAATPYGVASAVIARMEKPPGSITYRPGGNENQAWITVCYDAPCGSPSYSMIPIHYGSAPICPASVDPFNPAYSIPQGAPKVGGKCPTARYNHIPLSPQQAADQVAANPQGWPTDSWRDALRDAVDVGGQSVPSEITSSGPQSQTGEPVSTTTTGPGGTTTTTSTPTYNYVYGGETIQYNITTVTVTNNNGDVTTTTTTTPAPAPQDDPQDPCQANPGRVGCKQLGTPTDDKPVWAPEVVVPWAVEDLGLGGACPVPYVMTLREWRLVLNYQPACDVAPIVRAGLLTLTTLAAMFFVVSTVQK